MKISEEDLSTEIIEQLVNMVGEFTNVNDLAETLMLVEQRLVGKLKKGRLWLFISAQESL
ncbi:hypothetical protein HMPREF3206_01317 [Fusobacterium equinum]|uniref:Uncharacterized protein n=1 Tax=Fusobacterium equinum TaxID=134605 RepID=A0A133NAU0_9FUSO|nr:DNA-binding protein [Fusobacterium equinum]KXA13416.1 hypothetical protein HMPREF3206_01317 [Fusobacterium equinum]